MLEVKSNDGVVEIHAMEGTQDSVICDLGAACVKTVLLVANDGAKSKDEVLIRNGMLMRQLVEYLDRSIVMSDQVGNEN